MRLEQIDLVCADMDKTLAFYRLLGIVVPKKAIWRTPSGAHHAHIELPGGLSLQFNSPALARVYDKGYRATRRGGGNLVIGFSVSSRRAVDQAYAKLTKAGYAGMTPPWDAFWGARYAIVADPDENHVGIMSPSDDTQRRPPPNV